MTINNQFIKEHAPIVRTIARQYRIPNVSMRDLMQEGYIGLIEAAKRYDPNTGVKFDSYASWWIRKYMREYIIRYGQTVSLPFTHNDIFDHITEDINAVLYEEDGDAITFADCITDDTDTEANQAHQQQLKQNFPLKYFYGESVNAIESQIWVTMIANLLLLYFYGTYTVHTRYILRMQKGCNIKSTYKRANPLHSLHS